MLGPDGLATKEWFSPAESENPILTHAWHMFGQGGEGERRALKAKTALLESLQGIGMTGAEPFCDLDRSVLMARTFWGQDEMALFRPSFDAGTFAVLPCTKQERGEKSLVKVHRQIGVSPVQSKLKELFGCHTEGDRSIVSAPDRPAIIRVEYHPAEDPKDRPLFHSFRLIDFPAWTFHKTEGDTYFETAGRVPCTLLAVVRHRYEPTGSDSVRTYSANGANIVFQYEPREYTPGSWSLEDAKPHTYTLFYGRPHPNMLPLPPLPELDTRTANLDLWHHVDVTMKGQSSAKKMQTAGGTSRQDPKTATPQGGPPVARHNRQPKGDQIPALKRSRAHHSARWGRPNKRSLKLARKNYELLEMDWAMAMLKTAIKNTMMKATMKNHDDENGSDENCDDEIDGNDENDGSDENDGNDGNSNGEDGEGKNNKLTTLLVL
ncbi:hypothetical protein CEP51_016013 [Fusarium floridanum]|uniref:Uncharacterized protein n=1 Tax=Fusarium floridanum TaxID=1325733 RepID=A0A428NYK8_9HYPO|nr:hypothetical protein CEP51_016013 [Fusarium floridanum]